MSVCSQQGACVLPLLFVISMPVFASRAHLFVFISYVAIYFLNFSTSARLPLKASAQGADCFVALLHKERRQGTVTHFIKQRANKQAYFYPQHRAVDKKEIPK